MTTTVRKDRGRKVVERILRNRELRELVAERLDIKPQAVYGWARLQGVPVRRVAIVSKILGLAPHHIRPDYFPPPD